VPANPVQKLPAAGRAVSDCGYDVIGNRCPRLVSGWGYEISAHGFAPRFARLERRPKLQRRPLDQYIGSDRATPEHKHRYHRRVLMPYRERLLPQV
jgi:hypothetical protein